MDAGKERGFYSPGCRANGNRAFATGTWQRGLGKPRSDSCFRASNARAFSSDEADLRTFSCGEGGSLMLGALLTLWSGSTEAVPPSLGLPFVIARAIGKRVFSPFFVSFRVFRGRTSAVASGFNPKPILAKDNHGEVNRAIFWEHSEQSGIGLAPIRNRIRIENHRQFSGSTRPNSSAIRWATFRDSALLTFGGGTGQSPSVPPVFSLPSCPN